MRALTRISAGNRKVFQGFRIWLQPYRNVGNDDGFSRCGCAWSARNRISNRSGMHECVPWHESQPGIV